MVFSSSPASDSFVFGLHFGNDAVANSQPAIDQIQIDHTLFATVRDLLSHTADDANGSAAVTVGAGQSIMVEDASKTLLQHSSDFHLV
jgi:uncharacterized membrane protein